MRIRIMPLLLALFVGLPLLDVVLLVFLGRYIGFWETVALVILSGVLGAWLAKREGVAIWRGIQQAMAEGRVPEQGLLDAALILVAGGMLSAPGFVTDLLGLALLLPAARVPVKGYLRRKMEAMVVRVG